MCVPMVTIKQVMTVNSRDGLVTSNASMISRSQPDLISPDFIDHHNG
jgi:hypothetical protein